METFYGFMLEHRGFNSREGIEDALMAILFNTMAYADKLLKENRNDKSEVKK